MLIITSPLARELSNGHKNGFLNIFNIQFDAVSFVTEYVHIYVINTRETCCLLYTTSL